jgi:hypothetical protein
LDVGFLRRLQADLGGPLLDDDTLRERLTGNFALLEAFARSWQSTAAAQYPALARFVTDTRGEVPLDIAALRLSEVRLPA